MLTKEDKMVAKKKEEGVKLSAVRPFVDKRYLKCRLTGINPLIVHAWAQKALMEMLGKQRKHPKGGRPIREPEEEYEAAKYKDINGKDAFLAAGVKNAMVTAVTSVDGMTKVGARQSFFIYGTVDQERVTILFDKKKDGKMREDMVRLGGPSNPADIRFRPEYQDWEADIVVEYNALMISKDQFLNLLALAGYAVGLHEWRPEKDGNYGRFEVTNVEELKKRPKWDRSTIYLRKKETSVWSAIKALEEEKAISGKEVAKAIKKEADA
jgi:hypothetical protein